MSISPSFFSRLMKKEFLPAWIILALSMSATLILWHKDRSDVIRDARADFEFRVTELNNAILHRMRGYEQVLRGGVGLFNASQYVDRSEWHEYVKSLRIEQRYPGIQGVGFSEVIPAGGIEAHTRRVRSEGLSGYSVWPVGERPLYTSILYLEPLDWRNRRAIGYDMYSEPVRREAMDRAAGNDQAAVSGKVTLVQETQKDVQAGVLMYLPVYRKDYPHGTPAERRKALIGFVYSPFRMNDLMKNIIGREDPDVNIEIFDGGISKENLMYDSDTIDHFTEESGAMFEKSSTLELNGRTWTVHLSTLPAFEAAIDMEKPALVLAAGTVISLLFFAIAFFLASHRARLKAVNSALNAEIVERLRAEEELRVAHDRLEARVTERTGELTVASYELRNEITTRGRAEAALRESEERFRSLIETTNDWVWAVDANGIYTYVSPRVRDLLGYEPEEVLGKTPFDLMPPDEAERVYAEFSSIASRKEPFALLENKNLHKDGRAVILETNGTPILDAQGNLHGYRGIDRDVTERKRIEREKDEMHSQLLQSQRMKLMGRLAGGIAHDFNNIMTIITSLNGLAMREARGKAIRDYLEQIQAASERAISLTRQLLIFSKSQPTQTSVLDLNGTVDEMLRLLKHILGENIVIKSDLSKGLLPVQADRSNMEQVLMNLVVNSKEAMPGGGSITISTANKTIKGGEVPGLASGSYVCLRVDDTGAGMDTETLKRVFEPFFSTKGAGKGIGLGLTVVQNIVKEYNGGISVESRPGQGTSFRIYLPACVATPAAGAGEKARRETKGKGEKILIIEDEAALSRSVALVLTKNGYTVSTAMDAEEALEVFQGGRAGFDLVFSDVVLKGRSGVNIVDELLRLSPGLKVVFASGYMDIESQWPYIREKGFRFLQKPYDIPELLRAVRESLGGPGRNTRT